MENQSFSTSFIVNKTPSQAFAAINDVRGWWTENLAGNTQKLHDEFSVRFGDVHYSNQKLVEVIPDAKVVWLVTESNLSFTENKAEWTGSRIVFELLPKLNQTEITFTHAGLVPSLECFGACSQAWTGYVQNSLKDLITIGKGNPERKE